MCVCVCVCVCVSWGRGPGELDGGRGHPSTRESAGNKDMQERKKSELEREHSVLLAGDSEVYSEQQPAMHAAAIEE